MKGSFFSWLVIAGFLSLFLATASCSGGNQTKLSPPVVPEVHDETEDTACAYFYFLWGKSAELEEKYEEALEAYEKALVCDENGAYIHQKLATLLLNMGKKEQAIVQLEQMIAAEPDNIEYRILLGNAYEYIDRRDRARKVYEKILEMAPEDEQTLMLLGALYAREREYTKAKEILERLVKVDAKSYVGHSYLAKLYRELRFYDQALASYEKALSLNWSTMLALETADLYEYRHRYEDAIGIYRRLLEENENNAKIRGRLVQLYLEIDDVGRALAELEELRNYSEDTTLIDMAIGRLYLDEKMYGKAIGLFENMLEEDPDQEMARSLLALSYYEAGEIDRAKQILRGVSTGSKSFENSVLMLVQILDEEGKQQQAVDLLRKNIDNEKTRRPSFYYLLAGLLRETGDSRAGREVFERAVRDFPDDAKVLFEYGLYLDELGEMEEAMAMMEKVLAIDPDDAHALNYVGYTWAEEGTNLEKALDYVKRAVELRPEDGFIRDSLGWAHYKLGNIKEAVNELEAAVDLQPEDPTINEHLGDAYYRNGELKKALAAYEKALSLLEDAAKKAQVAAKVESLKKDRDP